MNLEARAALSDDRSEEPIYRAVARSLDRRGAVRRICRRGTDGAHGLAGRGFVTARHSPSVVAPAAAAVFAEYGVLVARRAAA